LHAESDEECAAVAMRLRSTFDYLLTQLGPVIERAKAYREHLAKRATAPKT